MSQDLHQAVSAHYSRSNLIDVIIERLRQSGADPDAIKPDDLAPVDEFHTAGRKATVKAVEMMPLRAGMHVLDAGCGIGGTARYLANDHDCRVTGIDLTPGYIDVARELTARTGLDQHCSFEVASVTDMPFDDGRFDAALTFHVAMNVADRPSFYGELARVMRAGAPLCLFDVMKGPTDGMRYPVPWAETEATSFLKSRDQTVHLLNEAGFDLIGEQNLRDFAIGFFQEVFAKAKQAGGPPPLSVNLLTGANGPTKFENYFDCLTAHQIEPVILIAARRG